MHPSTDQLRMEIQIQEQSNNVTRVIKMIILAALILTGLEFYLAANLEAWQMLSAAWTLVVFDVFLVIGWWLARSGRPVWGLWLVFIDMSVIWVVSTAFFLANIGFFMGLSLLLVIPLMAIQTLKTDQVVRAAFWSLITAFAMLLAEIFGADNRLVVPALETLLPIATILLGIAYAVFVFRQFPRYSIRTKFIVSAVALVTVTIIGLTFIISKNTEETIVNATGQRLSSVANSHGLAIGELLARQVGLIQTLSLNQAIQTKVQEANNSYGDERNQVEQALDSLESEWQAAEFTDPLPQSRLNNLVARELLEFQGRFRTNINVMATDQFGGLVGAINYVDHYSYSEEIWWQTAYNNGRGATFIGAPEVDRATNLFQVVIAIPIFGSNSQTAVGVLQSTYSLRDLGDILFAAQQEIGETTHLDLLLPPNRIVDIEGTQVEASLSPTTLALLEENRNKQFGQFEFEGGFNVISQENVNTLLHVPDIDALGWVVITHQPLADSLAPVREQQQTFIIIGFIAVLLASGGAALFGQNLARPIVNLTDTAVQVSEGDLLVQARIETTDELGTLAQAFNVMTTRLRQTIASQEQRISERTRALEVSAEVSRKLSTILDEKELVREMVDQVQTAFNYYHAHIYLFDEAEENLVLVGGTGEPGRKMLEAGHQISRGKGLVGRAVNTRKTVLVQDVFNEPDWLPNPRLPETVTEVAVPILVGDEVLGALDVQHNVRGLLNQEDADLLQSIANQVAIALQNARSYRRAQRRAQREALLNKIGQAIQSAATIESAMQTAVRELGSALPPVQNIENLSPLSETGHDRGLASSVTLRLVRETWETYAEDLLGQSDGYLYARDQVSAFQANGIDGQKPEGLVLPLTVRGQQIGQFEINGIANDVEQVSDFVGVVADRLSAHIENLRLSTQTEAALKSTERRAEELAVINQIAQAVSGQTGQTELLKTVYEQIQRVMPVDAFSVTVYEAKTEMIHYLMVMDEGKQFEEPPTPLGSGSISQVIREGQPILLNRTMAELDELARNQKGILIGNVQRLSASMIYLPLQIGTETIGGLSVQSYQIDAYTQAEVDLLVGVANHVAIALENTRLFEETQNTLAETELLYRIGRHINQSDTLFDLVAVVGIPGIADGADSAGLFRFIPGENGQAEWMELAASWVSPGSTESNVGRRFYLPEMPLAAAKLYTPEGPSLIGNVAEDKQLDDDARQQLQGSATRAVAVIPMQQSGASIGTLIILWPDPRDFKPQDHRLYNSLASQLSTALSNQLLLTETQDRAAQLEKITRIERDLSQAQDEVGILEALTPFFDDKQAVSIHYVGEEDEPATAFTVAHWENGQLQLNDEMLYRPFDIQLHAGLSLSLKQPDRISFVYDILSDDRIGKVAVKESKKMGFRSILVIPLRSAGRWQGFVSIKWPQVHAFSAVEIAVWEQLRESLAAIIASRRAYLAQQDALSETAVLYETGAQLSVASSYDSVLAVLRKNTILGQNVTNVSLMLFEHEWQQAKTPNYADVLAFWSNKMPDQAKMRFHFKDYPSANKIIGDAMRPLIFEDVPNSIEMDENLKRMLVQGFNTKTFALFPMIVRGESIGYINAMYPGQTSFSEKEIRWTEAIIQQAGVAIQGLRNLEQAEQQAFEARNRTNELVILNEMGRALTALVDMDSILENVYRYTARLMDATNFYISFFDGKRNEIILALDIRGDQVRRNVGSRKAGKGLTEHIIYSREPLLIPENVDAKLEELGLEKIGPSSASWLGVPLMVGRQVIGVIGLRNWKVPRTYNEQHLRLLTSVAAQAAIAIENARLFEQIQARARRERILREVTAKVRGMADADTIMRTAVSEIGRALGRRTYVYLNEMDQQEMNPDKEEAYGD